MEKITKYEKLYNNQITSEKLNKIFTQSNPIELFLLENIQKIYPDQKSPVQHSTPKVEDHKNSVIDNKIQKPLSVSIGSGLGASAGLIAGSVGGFFVAPFITSLIGPIAVVTIGFALAPVTLGLSIFFGAIAGALLVGMASYGIGAKVNEVNINNVDNSAGSVVTIQNPYNSPILQNQNKGKEPNPCSTDKQSSPETSPTSSCNEQTPDTSSSRSSSSRDTKEKIVTEEIIPRNSIKP